MSLFSKPDIHSVLLIDIASSSVGIGLSGIHDGALPELVFSARIPFGYKLDFDLAHIEPAMMLALHNVLSIAHREGSYLLKRRGYPGAINHAVISFSSPWYASALGRDHLGFRSRLEERFGAPVEVFEAQDGLMSAIERRLVKKIEEAVIRTFGIREGIGLSSFTFSVARVAKHAFSGLEPVTFADMTGHTTDMLSMRGNEFKRKVSVPVGTHTLKREADMPWDSFWKKLSEEHDEEFHRGNVFLIADDYATGHTHLSKLFPGARIIPFGAGRGFIEEMVRHPQSTGPIERLAILATYSNLFL